MLDRFSKESQWQKILFNPDRRLQGSELLELQSLIKSQQAGGFNYIWGNYKIISGLELKLDSIEAESYTLILNPGVVYFEGDFIRVDAVSFTALKNTRTKVNLTFSFIESNEEFEDPILGVGFFSQYGAKRQIAIAEVTNEDGWPIALVESFNNEINISYFDNGKLENKLPSKVPPVFEKDIYLKLLEEGGNFISVGLEVKLKDNILYVFPGQAYVEGFKVTLVNSTYFNLSDLNFKESWLALTKEGKVQLNPTFTEGIILSKVFKQTTPILEHFITPSKQRAVYVDELKFVLESNNQLQEQIIKLAQENQLISLLNTGDNTLSGTFIDSFKSLNYSDSNHYLFDCEIQKEKVFSKSVKESVSFASFEVIEQVGITVTNKYDQLEYLIPSYSSTPFLSNSGSSGIITLNSSNETIPVINVFQKAVDINQRTIVIGENFQNQNNLKVYVGNVRITEFTILEGASGSEYSTIDAGSSGFFKVSFLLPSSASNLVSLENSSVSALVDLKSNDTFNYNLANSGSLAQVFTITDSIMCSQIELAFRKLPAITDTIIGNVSIHRFINGVPSCEALTSSEININSLKTSFDGSVMSLIQFDYPADLEAGTYCFLINFYLDGVELFTNSGNFNDLYLYKSANWEVNPTRLIFNLYQAIPQNLNSYATFKLSKEVSFNSFQSKFIKLNSGIEYFYSLNNTTWYPLTSEVLLDKEYSDLYIRFSFTNSDNNFSVLDLSNSNLNTNLNKKEFTWISKTTTLENFYDKVQIKFNYYLPTGSTINVFISSNDQTWEELLLTDSTLIDGNISLYQGTYTKDNLSTVVEVFDVNNKSSNIKRKTLKLKVVGATNQSWLQPYIQRLSATTYF